MAAVTIDDKSRRDWRFQHLGVLCGQCRRWARDVMVDVWSQCTEEQSYVLSAGLLDAIAERVGFADHLVTANLGEDLGGGMVRVKGTEGRIEWLAKRRQAASKGGLATAAKRAAGAPPVQQTASTSAPLGAANERQEASTSAALGPYRGGTESRQTSTEQAPNPSTGAAPVQHLARQVVQQVAQQTSAKKRPIPIPNGTTYHSGSGSGSGARVRARDPDGTNGPSSGAGGEPEPDRRQEGRGPIPGSVTTLRVCATCGDPAAVQDQHRWLCFGCRFSPAVCDELDAGAAPDLPTALEEVT